MASISLKYKSKSGNLTAPGDVDPGAMIPLATTSLSTTAASITFSDIPQAYEHLQIRLFARGSASNPAGGVWIQFNGDTTASNYYSHYLQADGSTVVSGPNGNLNVHYDIAGANTTASAFGVIIFDILDYANTNKYTTIRSIGGVDGNGGGRVNMSSGLWKNTNAVLSVLLYPYSGSFVQYTHAALYGIKKAGA